MKPAKAEAGAERVERRGEPGRELEGGNNKPFSETVNHLHKTPLRVGKVRTNLKGDIQREIYFLKDGLTLIRVTCSEETDAVTPNVRFCEGENQ